MDHITASLIAIFSLILTGYFLKKISFPSKEFWPLADKFTYYVLFPSLLVYKLASAPGISIDSMYLVLVPVVSTILVLLILLLSNFWLKFLPDTFTSIVQGGIRFNTYIFLAIVDTLFGDQGLIIAAIILTFTIPLNNILCIGIFSIYIPKTQLSVLNVAKSIFTNPLIIACLIGGTINIAGMTIPLPIEKLLLILSSAASPLGLLSVGVGLHFTQVLSHKLGLILSSLTKLVLFPLITYIYAQYFHLSIINTQIVIIFASMPTAISSYILARQMGGHMELMSSIVTLQTLISIFSIALVLQLLF